MLWLLVSYFLRSRANHFYPFRAPVSEFQQFPALISLGELFSLLVRGRIIAVASCPVQCPCIAAFKYSNLRMKLNHIRLLAHRHICRPERYLNVKQVVRSR